MDVGREGEKLLKRLVEATERVAAANERLIELADAERESEMIVTGNPGYCPHCQTLNPRIRSEGGTGSLVEFVLAAQCQECGRTFFLIPEGWQAAKTTTEVRKMMEAGNGIA